MDILQQLRQIAQERDIPVEDLVEELEQSLAVAYKKYKGVAGDIRMRLDSSTKSGAVIDMEVVAEVMEPATQISLAQARKQHPNVEVGDFVPKEVDTFAFGRIAAQTFKQVLSQKLVEAEKRRAQGQFSGQMHGIMSGVVTRRDDVAVLLNVNGYEVELPKREQVPTDMYRPNDRMHVFILKIEDKMGRDRSGNMAARGFRVVVSRTHPNLVRKLLEAQVPEIAEGLVEIKGIARDPGQRTKIAVASLDERIDAVGACVGQRGARIQAIMDELHPEKIDILPYSEKPEQFIASALNPAKVNSIRLFPNEKPRTAKVVVPDSQLSLAIGRGGQNVRLAARLTDWKIDIDSESQAGLKSAEEKAGNPGG